MSTFSLVISRPSNNDLGSSKPAITMTCMGRDIWQPGHPAQNSPPSYKASIVGDFWTDTLFNPIWGSTTSAPTMTSSTNAPTSSIYSGPPSLMQDEDSAESSFLSMSSFDIDTPPSTAFSTAAVLGSARLSGAFEDDYDRPEASPNFIRKLLRRSRSLRLQARMRDGDYRHSDKEDDYSVASEWDPIVLPDAPRQQFLASDVSTSKPVDSEARLDRVPSRLSQRVKVPSPINTLRGHGPIGTKPRRNKYEVEVGQVDGSELTSSSESGFDADDEHDGLRDSAKTHDGMHAAHHVFASGNITMGKGTPALLSTPPKKSYAAIVATSAPRANTPESKTMVPQAIQAARILGAGRGDASRAFEWRPFVEPFDM